MSFTEFYWALLGFTGFYWVLLGFTLWLCFSQFSWSPKAIPGFDQVELDEL